MQVIFLGLLSPLSSNSQYSSCWICHVLCALSPAWMLRASPRIWFLLHLCHERMEVAVCGEVVSFGFPIVEGTLYLAVGFSQFCEAECVMPPMHVRDKVCKGFLLVAQLLLRPPLLDGGYFLQSPGYVSYRSFLQERNTCVEFLLLQRWHPVRHSLGGEAHSWRILRYWRFSERSMPAEFCRHRAWHDAWLRFSAAFFCLIRRILPTLHQHWQQC